MYDIELAITNQDSIVTHKDHIKMYSLWGARCHCRKLIECKDIAEALIIDTETGEIMLHLGTNGETLWDSEG